MSDSSTNQSAIEGLRAAFREGLKVANTEAALKGLNDAFLSRKSGKLTEQMKMLGSLSPEDRRVLGGLLNALKTEMESSIEEKRMALAASRPPADAVDVTLPSRARPVGHVHPLMLVRRRSRTSSPIWATKFSKGRRSRTTSTTSKR